MFFFFFSSRRRHTRCSRDWSSDVCSSDLRDCLLPLDESRMRALRALPVALAFVAMPGAPCAPQSTDMLDKIVAQEQAEIESLRQYSPVVETYIQIRRPDKQVGVAPGGDKYFLGHALLAKGVELIPLAKDTRSKRSEEHTSELQSRLHLVCRLLLATKTQASATQF